MESGGDPDLPLESGSAEGDRELGAEHLEATWRSCLKSRAR